MAPHITRSLHHSGVLPGCRTAACMYACTRCCCEAVLSPPPSPVPEGIEEDGLPHNKEPAEAYHSGLLPDIAFMHLQTVTDKLS